MTEVIVLKCNRAVIIEFDNEDMQDLLEIQLEKKTNFDDTVLACFHAGLVTILTHSPRKYERTSNHDQDRKNKKNQQKSKKN